MNAQPNFSQGFQLKKAERRKAKLRIGLFGPSGGGKTYSALLLARGIASSWDKIAVIDTERGSADLYAHLGDYNTLTLQAPFNPERYIEAINACEQAGVEVIVIDSISHEWEGAGGCLQIHEAMTGNSYMNWSKVTPRHNNFIEKILQSSCHVICCGRAKQEYALQEKNGKQVPEKLGLKAITREGFDYEMTLCFDIDIKHNASASKDRTGIFADQPAAIITEEFGQKLLAWSNFGSAPAETGTKDVLAHIQLVMKAAGISKEQAQKITGHKSMAGLSKEELQKALEQLNAYASNPERFQEAVSEAVEYQDALQKGEAEEIPH